jgi:hypothetical protein
MELIKKKVPVNHNLFLMGDDHEGTILRHHEGWSQFIDHVNSSIDGLPETANFVVDHGDIIDAIDPMDPRYDGLTEDGLILQQIERAIKNRLSIAKKIIVILDGNHPMKKWRFGRITKHICEKVGVSYGTWSSKITYVNNRNDLLYKHYCIHGRKSISSVADDPKRRRTNKQLSLKRALQNKSGDCVLMSRGHTHWLDRLPPEHDVYLADDGKKAFQQFTVADHTAEYIHPDLRWYVSCGSFLKNVITGMGISGYGEVGDYDPNLWCGYMLCKVRNGRIQTIEPIRLE